VLIGTIVKSNSHISYLCRVYGKLETEEVPGPDQYAFGTFVTLRPDDASPVRLVGVVRDTLLLNPDYGSLGPRLSSARDLEVLSPDYLNETGVLVDILVLVSVETGTARHVVPALAAGIGTSAETLDQQGVVDFHRDPRGRFLIGYYPQLLARPDPVVASLLLSILERLEPSFPGQGRVISVLKNNLAWKARVLPAG
jgi:hypothetical protein